MLSRRNSVCAVLSLSVLFEDKECWSDKCYGLI